MISPAADIENLAEPPELNVRTPPVSVIVHVPIVTVVARLDGVKPVKADPSMAGKAPVRYAEGKLLVVVSKSPVASGKTKVRFVLLLGEARVNVPVPAALGVRVILLMLKAPVAM